MSSKPPSAELDLERGLPTSAEDVRALREANQPLALTPAEYLRFLAQVNVPTDQLRNRPIFKGDPFTLRGS